MQEGGPKKQRGGEKEKEAGKAWEAEGVPHAGAQAKQQ